MSEWKCVLVLDSNLNVTAGTETALSQGKVIVKKQEYKKFKAQQNVAGDIVYEYLWFINKTKHKEDNNFIKEIEYITNL